MQAVSGEFRRAADIGCQQAVEDQDLSSHRHEHRILFA